MRRMMPIAVAMALVMAAVPVFAADGLSEADKGVGDTSKGINVCPRQSNGNETDFNVFRWNTLFTVQRASSGGVRVSIGFNEGSAQADVKLVNVSNGSSTPSVRLSSSKTSHTFTVGCGDWLMYVRSASAVYNASGSLSAYPQ